MKTNSLTRILSAVAFVAMLSASSSVFAQVKIGTNPTTIGATNNLEVEASTTGRKTSIDKTTGQVTIQDGTQGAGKVLTSDANGASSWQPASSSTTQTSEVVLSVESSTAQNVPNNYTVLNYNTKSVDKGNNFSLPSTFTAPSDGVYLLSMTVASAVQPASRNGRFMWFTVSGSANYSRAIINDGVEANDGYTATGTALLVLKAGDKIVTAAGAIGWQYNVTAAYLSIVKISN